MQIIIDIPDDIIAQSLNDTIELSLDIDRRGIVTSVYHQEYGFNELKYSTINSLNSVDILQLKRRKENQE